MKKNIKTVALILAVMILTAGFAACTNSDYLDGYQLGIHKYAVESKTVYESNNVMSELMVIGDDKIDYAKKCFDDALKIVYAVKRGPLNEVGTRDIINEAWIYTFASESAASSYYSKIDAGKKETFLGLDKYKDHTIVLKGDKIYVVDKVLEEPLNIKVK